MAPVIIEILKLRRSASWGVVLVLPVASVLSACVIVRPTDWQLLWIRSVGFYGMALLPVSLAASDFPPFPFPPAICSTRR